jgi:hypothetical protein
VKRLLALVAAVAMVAGAVAARDRLDETDGTTAESSGEATGGVLCVSELAAVCGELADGGRAVRVEDAGTTFELLTDPDLDPASLDFDAWLAPAPWPAMVAEARSRAGLGPALGAAGPTLARSPLVIVAWTDRAAVLGSACGDALGWACIGSSADAPWAEVGGPPSWGTVKPGFDDPAESATGLAVLAQGATEVAGTGDLASNDFTVPQVSEWFRRLGDAVADLEPPRGTPLERMLSVGPAAFDVVGDTEAAAAPTVARSRDADRLTVIYPAPVATLDIVAVGVPGDRGDALAGELADSDELRSALRDDGWRVDGSVPTGGDGSVTVNDDDDGLPAPGAMEALRTLWLEVIR